MAQISLTIRDNLYAKEVEAVAAMTAGAADNDTAAIGAGDVKVLTAFI